MHGKRKGYQQIPRNLSKCCNSGYEWSIYGVLVVPSSVSMGTNAYLPSRQLGKLRTGTRLPIAIICRDQALILLKSLDTRRLFGQDSIYLITIWYVFQYMVQDTYNTISRYVIKFIYWWVNVGYTRGIYVPYTYSVKLRCQFGNFENELPTLS